MIILILILGLILRLVSLNQSLWLDEATSALVSNMSLNEFFSRFIPFDFHPPLYYLSLNFWIKIFGNSEISLRMPSVIFGVLTVYVVYLISSNLKFKNKYLASLLLATSGLHVYYSQEARMYSLATLLVSVIIYLYLKRSWLMLSVTLPVLFLSDYLSILIVPVLFVYILINDSKNVTKFLSSVSILILTILAWMPIFAQQLGRGLGLKNNMDAWWNILGTVNVKNILLIPVKFIIGRVTMDNKNLYTLVVGCCLALFVTLIVNSKNKLIKYWLYLSLVLGVVLSLFVPTLTYFRYLFVLPAFYLLVADGIEHFNIRYQNVLIIIVLFINLSTTSIYLLNDKFHRENWRDISRIIGSEKILLPANSQKEALIYYGVGDQIISKEQLTVKIKEVWLSRYVWEIFDPMDTTGKYIEDLGYNKVSDLNLNGVLFYKYENRN